MSMTILTILQFAELFLAYSFMCFGLPAFVLRGKIKGRKFAERMMFYFLCGNFFMMHIVFILQLLRISNRGTIYLGSILIIVLFEMGLRGESTKKYCQEIVRNYKKIQKRQLGIKSVISRIVNKIINGIKMAIFLVGKALVQNGPSVIFSVVFVMAFLWMFGFQKLRSYGYSVSDIPVHLSWINAMLKNDIFTDGVYPFGFHCIVYYLNRVFFIDVYAILRVMSLVQALYVFIILLWFLKLCCKSKYTPYIGLFIYVVGNYFKNDTYSRYYSSLPQEFGIMFILPTIYFAFKFFREKRREIDKTKAMMAINIIADDNKEKNSEQEVAAQEITVQDAAVQGVSNPEITAQTENQGNKKADKQNKSLIEKLKKNQKNNQDNNQDNKPKMKFEDRFSAWYKTWRYETSSYCLAGFAMSFAMALNVHFYGTMIIGLFCVAMVIGYIGYVFRKEYFFKIIITVIISVLIAVAPMVIAFVTGTPLQGSLNWGMKVMNGSLEEESSEAEISTDKNGNMIKIEYGTDEAGNSVEKVVILETDAAGNIIENGTYENGESAEVETDAEGNVVKTSEKETDAEGNIIESESGNGDGSDEKVVKLSEINAKVKKLISKYKHSMKRRIFKGSQRKILVIPICIAILFIGGIICIFMRRIGYGSMMISTAVFMVLMVLLQCAESLDLPQIMDGNRAGVYFCYMLSAAIAMAVDVICYIIGKLTGLNSFNNVLSFIFAVLVLVDIVFYTGVKTPAMDDVLETNEAIACISNIIHEDTDFTWDIISANDETQMVKEHGWHWELSTFLKSIENITEDTSVTLQAKTLYFFIEKMPIEYAEMDEPFDTGQTISVRGADMSLPTGSGLSQYCSRNRWIYMSRIYYWAKAMQELYPDDMTVYMETDRFICYRLQQNEYRLYNLAIDYGYNNVEDSEGE